MSYVLYGVIVLFILLVIIIFYQFKENKKLKYGLERVNNSLDNNQEKTQILTMISDGQIKKIF